MKRREKRGCIEGEDTGCSRFRLKFGGTRTYTEVAVDTPAPYPPASLLSANLGLPFHFPITFCPHREGRHVTL